MDISTTYAKQEVDIIKKILDQSSYSEKLDEISLELSNFEGKHFRHLTSEQLLKRVKEVSIKFKNEGLINNYSFNNKKSMSKDLLIIFNIKNRISNLEQYKEKVETYILKTEMQSKLKKGRLYWLDYDTKSFYFTLPNGAVEIIRLNTQRSASDHMFLFFKVLYEHWLKFEVQVITKSKIISELDKLGWYEVNEGTIKNYVGNLRTKLIEPANLGNYIQISPDRKLKGYNLKIGNS